MALTGLFDAEPLIIARIKARVPALRTVASAAILAGARDIAPLCPAAFVLPGMGELQSQSGDGVVSTERQFWQIVVAVDYLQDETDLDTPASRAGVYLLGICKALQGWAPSADLEKMRYVPPRPQPYYEIGYAEFPVVFETRVVINANH